MNEEAPPPVDPRVAAIIDTLALLGEGDRAARALGAGKGDTLDRSIDQLNRLADELSTQHAALIENERRATELLDVLSGMAALDFTRRAWVGEAGTVTDAVAFGVNSLGEELAASTVSRAYVDNIIESMLDALIVVDERGAIKTVNRAALRLFGYSKEALVERPIAALFARKEEAEQVLEAVTRGAGVEETTCRASDGRAIPVSLSASAMHHTSGALEGIVCTVRDISERKQAEAALRRSIAQEETLRAQAATLAELSTPLIPISDKAVVMPLIGQVDSGRAQQVQEALLRGIFEAGAEVAILDITGVPVVDSDVANALINAARAVKLLGAQVVLTGIRPEVAQTLVGLGVDLGGVRTHGTLQSGIAAVLGPAR